MTIPPNEPVVRALLTAAVGELSMAALRGIAPVLSEDAPTTYCGIVAACRNHCHRTPFPVSPDGLCGSIYLSDRHNMLFRAWHDTVHAQEGRGLDHEGEVHVSLVQAGDVADWLCCLDIPHPQRLLVVTYLLADTLGQALYHKFTGGGFVADQLGFVRHVVGGTGWIDRDQLPTSPPEGLTHEQFVDLVRSVGLHARRITSIRATALAARGG